MRVRNLLPACKNIGATHITNGCYCLHPVEWNIGESAGLLAAFCVLRGVEPHQVYETPALLKEYQSLQRNQGIPLEWHCKVKSLLRAHASAEQGEPQGGGEL